MLLAVGDTIPLSCYFHPVDAITSVRATITTRMPHGVLLDNVLLDAIDGAPGLFGLEVESMPDAAFIDVNYYAFKSGATDYSLLANEQFGRLDYIESGALIETRPLIGIIVDTALVGVITDIT